MAIEWYGCRISPVPSEIVDRVRNMKERLDALDEERARLQSEIDEIIAAAGIRPDKRRGRPAKLVGRRPIRENSVLWYARQVLAQRGLPWYIDDLVKDVANLSGKPVQKTSLVSSLSRYIRAGEVFERPKEGYYRLREKHDEEVSGAA